MSVLASEEIKIQDNPEEKVSKKEKRAKKKDAKLSLQILVRLFASFSFKFNMLVSRRLSKKL